MRYTRRIRRGETIAPAAHRQWRHARRSAHVSVPAGSRLAIFVEHMGHINYGPLLVDDRKGIVEPVALGGGRLTGWDMFRLPFDAPSAVTPDSIDAGGRPTVYRGSFTIDSTRRHVPRHAQLEPRHRLRERREPGPPLAGGSAADALSARRLAAPGTKRGRGVRSRGTY